MWLANSETLRVYKMTKKDDGGFTFTAASGDFPKKHKAPVINIGVAETGMERGRSLCEARAQPRFPRKAGAGGAGGLALARPVPAPALDAPWSQVPLLAFVPWSDVEGLAFRQPVLLEAQNSLPAVPSRSSRIVRDAVAQRCGLSVERVAAPCPPASL